MSDNKKIIEINGIKLEVDLSNAKVVSNYKIGDNVKVLIKEYSSYESFPGVIVGFDNFQQRPSINIAYLKARYSEAEIKIICFNTESKDIEICPITNPNELTFDKKNVLSLFEKKILSKTEELKSLERQRDYFIDAFGKYFESEVEKC